IAKTANSDDVVVRRVSGCHLLVESRRGEGARVAETLTSLLDPGPSLEIRGRIVNGATTVAEFRLPTLAGRVATIWSGVEGACIGDWDVDVADQALCGNPDIIWFLDGFALEIVAFPMRSDGMELQTSGVINLLERPPEA